MHTQLFRVLLLTLLFTAFLNGCSREDTSQQAQDYISRAETYRDQGQYRAAMIEATNAMNSAPGDVRYALVMAEMYNTLGAARRASNLLEEFLESEPNEVALPLAEAYLMQGKFLSAEEALESYAPQTDDQTRLKAIYQADATRIRGELEQSEAAYEQLLEQYPGDLEIQLRLAENHIFRGQADQAEEILTRLREEHPEESEVHHFSAIVALQSNELEQAESYLTDALINAPEADMMLPDRASILELLSETLTALGRTTEALVYTKVLAEESPDTFEAQEQLKDAVAAAEQGNLEEAERLLQGLLDENPESQSAALMLGMVNLRQGDLAEAEPLLTGSVDVETANAEVIQAMAMAQARTGNVEQALASLERSLEARPNEPVLLSIYGMLALSTPEHQEKGYMSLQKALAQDPHRGGLRLALARHHFQKDETEQGMAQLRSAFSYQPADWAVTNVYMNQLFSQDELREISEALEVLREAAPRARETALFEGQYQFRNDNQSQGVRQLRELTRREPDYARAHGVLAQMLYEQGDTAQALESLERVIALEPNNDQALRAGVEIITMSELEMEPQEWLAQVGERQSAARPNTTALRAMMQRDQNQFEQATKLLRDFDGEANDYLRQTESLVFRDYSRELAGDGEYDKARELLMEALERFPNSKTLNMDLVRLDVAQERFKEAKVLLEDLSQRYPGDAEIAVLRARTTLAEQGPAQAYNELRQIWNEQPDGRMAGLLLDLARQQDPEAVPEILQAWEEAEPDNRGRLLYMAEQYQREGDEIAAITTYEQILERNPEDPVVLNNLAWLLKDRELPRAAAMAEQAANLRPNSPAILDTYGWLLHLQGDREGALTQLERAAELAPNVEDIQRNLQTVRNTD